MASPNQPNILFIMSDDHAAHAIGAYGGRLAELDPTPTLDRLAEEGMLFENAFCTNSICAPSRAAIITGQYPHTAGVHDLRGGIEAGSRTDAIVENVDFAPTLLDFAGAETPDYMQGRSTTTPTTPRSSPT